MCETFSQSGAKSHLKRSVRSVRHRHCRDREKSEKRSYRFMQTIPATMAGKKNLFDIFDRNVERWTWSTLLMDAFTLRTLNLFCFRIPMTDFVEAHMKKPAKEVQWPPNAKTFPPSWVSNLRPQPPPLPPPGDEGKHKKPRGSYRKIQAHREKYLIKWQTHQDRCSSTCSNQKTNLLFSKHQPLHPDLLGQPGAREHNF